MGRNKYFSGLPKIAIYLLSTVSIAVIAFVFVFIFYKSWPVLKGSGLSLITEGGFDTKVQEVFNSEVFGTAAPDKPFAFGMLALLAGTLLTTLAALSSAAFIGVGAALIVCEYSSGRVSAILMTLVRLLASIPSVVFGLIGFKVLVPFINDKMIWSEAEKFISVDQYIEYMTKYNVYLSGECLLTAMAVLTFMVVPMVTSLAVDAIRAVPHSQKETGFAFGMSKFRVIYKIILPNARSGITAGVILAAGRGIGEAIAVSMVCGGVGFIPKAALGLSNFLAPVLTLASAIINKSESMGTTAALDSALFTCGAILLILGAFLSIGAGIVEKRMRKIAGYDN